MSDSQEENIACPFDGCGWEREYNPDDYHDKLDADYAAETHYERQHGGEVRVRVMLEWTEVLGSRSPQEVSDAAHDEWAPAENGADLVFTYAEVIEEADDHARAEQ